MADEIIETVSMDNAILDEEYSIQKEKELSTRISQLFQSIGKFISLHRKQMIPLFVFLSFYFTTVVWSALVLPLQKVPLYITEGGTVVPLANASPSWNHLLGTTREGYDYLQMIIVGTRNSLNLGFLCGSICALISLLIGTIGPYIGGFLDVVLQLITNIILVFPVTPFILMLAAMTREVNFTGIINDYTIILFVIAFFNWPWAARAIRSQVLTLKERNYVHLAKISGNSKIKIAFGDIIPNCASYAFLVLVIVIGGAILTEAGLAVIGLGQTDRLTLGKLLIEADRNNSLHTREYHIWMPPGIFIGTLLLMLYVLNNSMGEIFNPRLRDK